jgi:hypothetical protein
MPAVYAIGTFTTVTGYLVGLDTLRSTTDIVLCCSLMMRTTASPWTSAYKRPTTTVFWTSTQEKLKVFMRST